VLALKDVDDCLLWAPNVKVLILEGLAALQNHLLSLVELGEEAFASIACGITLNFISDLLCKD